MEITGKNLSATMEAYAGKIQQTKRPAPAAEEKDQPAVKGDTVSLSKEAKTVASVKQKLEETPDIRNDKVAEIQKKINTGTYTVDGQQAANNLLKETLINQLV